MINFNDVKSVLFNIYNPLTCAIFALIAYMITCIRSILIKNGIKQIDHERLPLEILNNVHCTETI